MKITNANEAVGILVQGCEIATKNGVFSLGETRMVVEAIEFLNPDYFKQEGEVEVPEDIDDPETLPEDVVETPKMKEYSL